MKTTKEVLNLALKIVIENFNKEACYLCPFELIETCAQGDNSPECIKRIKNYAIKIAKLDLKKRRKNNEI